MNKTPNISSKSNITIIQNTTWVLALNFKRLPFITFTRIVGFINSSGSRLLSSFTLGLIINWVTEYISDSNANRRFLIYCLLAFGGYYLITSLASILRNYGENLSGFHLSYAIPETMLHEKLNVLSTATLENPEIQNKINRYRENRSVINTASRNILMIIGFGVSLTVAILPLLSIIPITAITLIFISIPNLIINKRIFAKMWELDKEVTVLSRRGGSIVGMITEPEFLKEVKLLNAYKYLKRYFDDYVFTYFGKKKKIYNQWSAFDILNTILKGSVILFGIYQVINLASLGKISVGQIVFYISALTIVSDQIDNFSAYISDYLGTNLRLTEMRELLEYEEVGRKAEKEIKTLIDPPHIVMKNVFFSYPNSKKYVIKNLNLEIKPGEKIAIVGENGAGKTTLIKLISNIYPVTKGQILINGENLNNIVPSTWFNNLGVLYQDYNTYNDLSAKENIVLGRISEDIHQENIEDAAKKADAHEFIKRFENGYDQVLSEKYEGGTRPSTGQWQKIAIARFFYRNSPILILDEPTASIDAVAEANIFDKIYSFIQNKTVIIVSHRFSTVRNADRIIVFDKGQIVEEGTHQQLLEKNGTYAHAFRLQAKGYVE